MGWYSSAFKRRAPVTVNVIGGGGGVGPVDVSISISNKFDAFWANIRNDGFDIVIADKFGDLATFKRATFDQPNKTLTLEVDNITMDSLDDMNVIWLYWDSPNQGSDLASVFTAAATKSGVVHQGGPTGFIVANTRNQAISNQPITTLIKDPGEKVDIWFSMGGLFEQRRTPSNGRNLFDDPSWAEVEVLTSGGVNSASRYDATKTRFIDGWVRIRVIAGDDGSDYSARCVVHSVNGNVYVLSALLKVQKLLPEA